MNEMDIHVRARARKRIPHTPLILNISKSGITPSFKFGRLTWSPKRRTVSVDTPGIGSVVLTPGRTRSRNTAKPATGRRAPAATPPPATTGGLLAALVRRLLALALVLALAALAARSGTHLAAL